MKVDVRIFVSFCFSHRVYHKIIREVSMNCANVSSDPQEKTYFQKF